MNQQRRDGGGVNLRTIQRRDQRTDQQSDLRLGQTGRLVLATVLALAFACLVWLSGCSTTEPTRWYELRGDLPTQAGSQIKSATRSDGPVWVVSPRVALPGALDRDTLQVAAGSAVLLPLTGHRWAEPLRDSVPRVLLQDLQTLRGAQNMWAAPVPAGVVAAAELRPELLTLHADVDRRVMRLVARWWWVEAALPLAKPRVGQVDLAWPLVDNSAPTVASAHRQVLWLLAQELAQRIATQSAQQAAPQSAQRQAAP
jgi:uncharacterized protein